MKISGFTFVRNGFKLGYPVLESLQSLLDICDEVVIAIGNSDDETEDEDASISSSEDSSEEDEEENQPKKNFTEQGITHMHVVLAIPAPNTKLVSGPPNNT